MLTEPRTSYKPFRYPWAHQAFMEQQQMHWLPEEVPLADDVIDWNSKLTSIEKDFLINIFRFFTQGDLDIADEYLDTYIPLMKAPEVRMMLTSFASQECIHIHAYSHLISTLGIPDKEYGTFMDLEPMREKHEVLKNYSKDPMSLIVTSALAEGVQLFSSFAMLLSFQKRGLLKGMGQIIAWSVRDESHHCNSIIRLFKEYLDEQEINLVSLQDRVEDITNQMVELEDAFIDLVYPENGQIEGLPLEDLRLYPRYLSNLRLQQLGFQPIFTCKVNPFPWVDDLAIPEHANFFETSSTAYSKASMTGAWIDAWNPWTLYSRDDCPWCEKARKLLERAGVHFVICKRNKGPVPFVEKPNGVIVGGYDRLVLELANV